MVQGVRDMATKKKIIDGIEFDANTPDRVVKVLLAYMGNKNQRIRLFYGDSKTGRDWCEEWGTMGYVGKSTGNIKIPLLISSKRAYGGSAILTGSIVRITVDKQNVYLHPKYKCDVTVRGNKVYKNGQEYAQCESADKAKKLVAFLKGETNVKG